MKIKKITIIFFITFLILGILVKLNITKSFDSQFYDLIIYFKSDILTNIFKIITFLGSYPFILSLNIIVLVLIIITKKNLFLIPINTILSILSNNIFKIIFKRLRPNILVLVTEKGYSYPSGHAMISILFYGSLIILINSLNIKGKRVINTLLLLIILLISISRVYLGVHYITDILGGYLLALSIISLTKEINI